MRPQGGIDPSWRGQSPQRAVAGAEIAVTTGMRVSEFSTLLDAELAAPSGVGASILLEACAKYQKRRRVSIPVSTLRTIDLYRQTERRALVRRSAASLWARRDELFVVDELDTAAGVARGRLDGRRFSDGGCTCCHLISDGSPLSSANMGLKPSASYSGEEACRSACGHGTRLFSSRAHVRST